MNNAGECKQIRWAAGGMHMDRYHWHRGSGRPLKAVCTLCKLSV